MRVSTQNQEDEETIESQRTELLKKIQEDAVSLGVDCIYEDDGWTGATLKRPGLDTLRNEAKDGKFEVVYIYDRGRLARPYFMQEVVIRELADINIECISLHDINATNPTENVMAGMMGLFHEYERIKIAERMRLGKLRKVRDRVKLLGYPPKYGYNYHLRIKSGPDERDGYFSKNVEQAKVVVQIFDWFASGMSKYAVRDELYKKGILPAKLKRDQWCTSVLDRMVRDTTYKGEHYYNKSESVETKTPRKDIKYRRTLKGSRVTRPKEEWYMSKCPIIISPEVFDKVQEQLARNKRTNRRNNRKNKYLVGGVLECICGYARCGDPTQGNLYYRCNDRLNNACGTRKCFEKGLMQQCLMSWFGRM